MIRLYLGNIGSGKTLSMVREIVNNPAHVYITNIKLKGVKNHIFLSADKIIKKELIGHKKSGQAVYNYALNKEFWQNLDKSKIWHVVIDEAHTILNPRRSMSKINVIMTDFLAMLRRVVQSNESNGNLTLITQLDRRLDIIAREMSTQVKYHRFHTRKRCACGFYVQEDNEVPEPLTDCIRCGKRLKPTLRYIEVFSFTDIDAYMLWRYAGRKAYYSRVVIKNPELYFKNYDTLQWDELLSGY